ncbi:hypothetical protein [Klebsiella phage 05F01]|nr:hypothetical protein [Klebsiella phage 05F01]
MYYPTMVSVKWLPPSAESLLYLSKSCNATRLIFLS